MPKKKQTTQKDVDSVSAAIEDSFRRFLDARSTVTGRFKNTDLVMIKVEAVTAAFQNLRKCVVTEMSKKISN